jgi:DNA-binding GntR family transcriptional regulator
MTSSSNAAFDTVDVLRLPGLDLWRDSPAPPRHEVQILDVVHRMFDFSIDRTNTQDRRVLHLRALHLLDGQPVLLERRVMYDRLVFEAMGSSERAFADPLGAWRAMPGIAIDQAKFAFDDTRAVSCPAEEAVLLEGKVGDPAVVHRYEAADHGHLMFFTVQQCAVRMKLRTLDGRAYWDYLD